MLESEVNCMTERKIISDSSEWTNELLEKYDVEIARIAEKFNLDTYPNQVEIISAEQMMDAYSSVGMPLGYNHWSFGKQFLNVEKGYKRGHILSSSVITYSRPGLTLIPLLTIYFLQKIMSQNAKKNTALMR